MIRMSKLADYGLLLLAELAREPESAVCLTARQLAEATRLPFPVVSKVLKILSREGLLNSQRGANGGYSLARRPEAVSVGEVLAALEGPLAMTECVDAPGDCRQEPVCPVRRNWQAINHAVQGVLDAISLREMLDPHPVQLVNLTGSAAIKKTGRGPGLLKSGEVAAGKYSGRVLISAKN